jgi:hypothetical protein
MLQVDIWEALGESLPPSQRAALREGLSPLGEITREERLLQVSTLASLLESFGMYGTYLTGIPVLRTLFSENSFCLCVAVLGD